jgi:sporulation protein YlmC with PRC-barrel domain
MCLKGAAMNRFLALFAAALIATAAVPLVVPDLFAPDLFAQGQPQSLAAVRVDQRKLDTGYRASKVRGSSVTNEHGERIGTIDDIIISRDGHDAYAVLSVGGFLGLGDHLIAVPYSQLTMQESRIVLRGATKDALKVLPQYKYN